MERGSSLNKGHRQGWTGKGGRETIPLAPRLPPRKNAQLSLPLTPRPSPLTAQ